MRTHEIAYLRAGTRLIAQFRVEFRLFAYTQFGEKYSKAHEILRGKALLAPAAFLPMPALELRLQLQIDAVLRDFARTHAKI